MLRRPLNPLVRGRGSTKNGKPAAIDDDKENPTNVEETVVPTKSLAGDATAHSGGNPAGERLGGAHPGLNDQNPKPANNAKIAPMSYDVAAAATHVLLEEWSFSFNGSRPLQLTGRVFNNAAGFEDGDVLEYTSQIIEVEGRIATTKSGTSYYLGRPSSGFEQLRKQLWLCSRSGALGRDDGSSVPPFDTATPLDGIKLGSVVPCAPVRLPKVPGWSHQSGVALLHNWTTERTRAGFVAVVGTVYNCPGAFDGSENYHTSTVVDCRGRMLRTLEGAEYFLGRRTGADAEEKAAITGDQLVEQEAAALGLLEDLLAV